jgi:hypothetical protein
MMNFLVKTAQAAVELPSLNKTENIGDLISQIYTYSISIVGILVFFRFLYGGFIYLTAAGNTSKTGKAIGIMTNAIIGAVILFSAYAILNIINPDLLNVEFRFGPFGP